MKRTRRSMPSAPPHRVRVAMLQRGVPPRITAVAIVLVPLFTAALVTALAPIELATFVVLLALCVPFTLEQFCKDVEHGPFGPIE